MWQSRGAANYFPRRVETEKRREFFGARFLPFLVGCQPLIDDLEVSEALRIRRDGRGVCSFNHPSIH